MPVYMDRHDVSEMVTAEHVAQLHQQDLKIQHKFGCRGLTYWFDEKRKTAFCLVEAPNEQAIQDMHNQAHGQVPHRVIEVDSHIVESFLGRIEDPEKAQNTGLNIINDPAFRTIMVLDFKISTLKRSESIQFIITKHTELMANIFDHFSGSVVKQDEDSFLVSFESVSNAVWCALEAHSKFKELIVNIENTAVNLKVGLSAGAPVSEKNALFEDSIKLAERMCHNLKAEIVVSSEVKDLYKSENLNVFFDSELVFALTPSDEKFLHLLMDFTEKTWRNTDLKVDDFSKPLGYSKSQLYRKMIFLFNKSPNTFIREYRLSRALKELKKRTGNISEVAFETGFNSPSYFSKCFQKRYGILPSDYLHIQEK